VIEIDGSVAVVGDVMLDVYINGEANRLSPEAPVPIVSVTSRMQTLGGAGNVALNLSGLGCQVHLFGTRGNDLAGEAVVNILHSHKIESSIYVDQLLPTTTKTRIVANHQQLIRFDDERINGCDRCYRYLKTSISEVIPLVKAIILSDYGKGVLNYEMIKHVVCCAKENNIPVLVDPKRSDWACYEGVSIITPNVSELEKASNAECCEEDLIVLGCAENLRSLFDFNAVVVTRGAKGMLVVEENSHEFIPTVAKSVFDVSGAGDTVISTMAACICSGYSVLTAAKIANVAAGIVVGKLGTSPIEISELNQALVENVVYDEETI